MPSEHDVTIYWGNKPTYNRFKVALEVQDAVNMRALSREFVKVVDSAMDELKNTGEGWKDPAVILFVDKFASLGGSYNSHEGFGYCYEECKRRAG